MFTFPRTPALLILCGALLVGGGSAVAAAAHHTASTSSPATKATTPLRNAALVASAAVPGQFAGTSVAVSPAGTSSLPQPVTDVTTFGAVGDGHSDSTTAIHSALAAAEKRGGTLYFPAGHYMVTGGNSGGMDIHVRAGTPLTVAGAGANLVTITATNTGGGVLGITADHSVVQDLTLDSQTYNARQTLGLSGNYITVQRCTILGGSQFFAIYAIGPPGASAHNLVYNVGNQMLNLVVHDQVQNDGFSWSFQQNSLIENIDHTGSRLALYMDSYTTVQNYTYHPGWSGGATQGFWLSSPSDHITINNFTTYGQGGVMSHNSGMPNTNVTINDEKFLGTGGQLVVQGAVNLTINGCDYGSTNTLLLFAAIPIQNLVVENCAMMPMVRFGGASTVSGSFLNDNFPGCAPKNGGPKTTFYSWSGGKVSFMVNGGSWGNQSGGFFGGKNATFTVTNLTGY